MAIITAHIEWSPVVGATGYLIQYKEQDSDVWITPSSPANPTAGLSYDIEIETDTYYDGRILTQCPAGGKTIYFVMFEETVTFIWVEDTYTCEQDDIFTLSLTVSGLSSPQAILYYQPTNRYYIVDADDVTGNFWWFNPSTFNSPAGRNYIAGQPVAAPLQLKTAAIDKTNNRLLAAGDTSNGLIVYDIPTNTFTNVVYGTNSPGGFIRPSINLIGSDYYCVDLSGTPSIYIVPSSTLTVSSTIAVSSIPSNTTFFNTSYGLTLVNGEIWCTCNTRTSVAGAGNIGVYDTALTTLNDTIVVPGAITWPGGSNRYWQTHFYDEDNDRWYVHDIGSNTLHVINTLTKAVIYSLTFDNRETKSNCNVGFSLNTLTGELFASYFGLNTITDGSPILRFYKVNRATYTFENMFVGSSAANLTNRTGSNEFWAITPGIFEWNVPNTGWDTDGQAFKYTQ